MRRLFAFVMSLSLLVSLAVTASAATGRAFLLQEYDVVTEDIYCYGMQLPANGTLEVSVGSQILENVSLSTLEKEKVPVTLYCLVDCATSLSKSKINQRNDILLTFSSLMAPEDSMVLATIDSKLTESKPMSEKEVRDTAIQTISGQTWNTNLNDGISKALQNLHSNTSYNTNRSLVIISDGRDDGKSTATKETILKQIRESGISVYTVILSTQSVTDKELARQKQYAEESLGGFMSFPDEEKISGSVSAQKIWDSIKGSSAIKIDAEELPETETDQQLLFRYDVADTRYEDSILIRAVDLPEKPTEPSAETTEETEATEPGETDGEKEDLPVGLLYACGIGAVLLGVGIFLFFRLRKKPEPRKEVMELNETWPVDSLDESNSVLEQSASAEDVTIPVGDRCHVFAVAIMHPEITADFYLVPNMEITFGRNGKADIVLNEDDMKLSSCHGCFFWDGKMILVQDRQSKNGTAVNGEVCPEKVWLRIENGDVLRVGKYEYRITFQVESQ